MKKTDLVLNVLISATVILTCPLAARAQGKVPSEPAAKSSAPVENADKPLSQTFQPVPENKALETPHLGEIRKIGLAEAKLLWDQKSAVFIDGRSAISYDTRHIKGALSLPLGDKDAKLEEIKKNVPMDSVLAVYCNSESCGLSTRVAQILTQAGYKNVIIYSEGWSAWVQAGYPTEP